MIEDFDFMHDWYYWGQNRLGSFLPFVGVLFYSLGFSAFNAAGIAQLLIILTSSFLLWKLIQEPIVFLAGLCILLFPIYPFWMQLTPGHPYLAQFLFLLATLWVFYSSEIKISLKAALFPFFMGLAIWSSELSVVILGPLLIVHYKMVPRLFKQYGILIIAAVSSALSLSFLLFAKNHAKEKIEGYHEILASSEQIVASFQKHAMELGGLFMGETNKPLNQTLLYAILILFVLFLILAVRDFSRLQPLTRVLFLTGLLSYVLIHLTGWNAKMGMPFRYFTLSWFFFALSLVFMLRDLVRPSWIKYSLSLGLVMLIAFASIQFNDRFETGTEDRIRRLEALELIQEINAAPQSESRIAIIGSYWNTHLPDALSSKIVGLPRKGDQIRNFKLIDLARECESFILIRNEWMDHFPDEIEQWDISLVKDGEAQSINSISYCWYRKTTN